MIELGYVLAILVALLTGVSSLFTKKSLISLHATQFVAGKAIIDFALLIILAPFFAKWPGWPGIIFTFFAAIIGGTAGILVTKSIRHQSISETFPLFNLSPAILVVFALVFLKENIEPLHYVGIVAIMLGAYFLQVKKNDLLAPFKNLKNKYVIFVILAIIIYSASATFEKVFLGFIIEPLVYLWWIKLFLSLIFVSYDSVMYNPKEIKSVVRKNWKELGAITGISWVALGLLYMAIPLINISILIPIKRSSTLFSTILGGRLFQEGHYLQRAISCFVMFIGVVLMVL